MLLSGTMYSGLRSQRRITLCLQAYLIGYHSSMYTSRIHDVLGAGHDLVEDN